MNEGADVDNILKPTLDALSGPDGILIDDCQVQAVTSSWIDWTREDQQQLTIRIRHIADDFLPRQSLAFVDLGRNLYMPVHVGLPAEARTLIASYLASAVIGRDKLVALGAEFSSSRAIMPVQRVFHRSRLGKGFRLGTLLDYEQGRL
jgi:hypothetical protein